MKASVRWDGVEVSDARRRNEIYEKPLDEKLFAQP